MSDQPTSAEVYAATRAEMVSLARRLSPAQAATMVPAAPEWSVKDVVAHVVGINDDLVAGRLEGLGSDASTAAQVQARRALTIDEICDEWERLAPRVEAIAVADPFLGLRMLADLVIHRHDVAVAIDAEADRDGIGVAMSLDRYAPTFVDRAAQSGRGTAAVVTEARTWGDPSSAAVTVRGTAFDLLRSIAGRRTAEQVRNSLEWSVDPTPWLALVSTYGTPERPIE